MQESSESLCLELAPCHFYVHSSCQRNTRLGQHQWGREVYSPVVDGEGRLNICRTIIESTSGGMLGIMAVCAKSSDWVRRRLTELSRATVR